MRDDPFFTHRSLLFNVAYEMLGSAADAEDVVQETWLRWANVAGRTRPTGALAIRLRRTLPRHLADPEQPWS